jgi:hypothetical protein
VQHEAAEESQMDKNVDVQIMVAMAAIRAGNELEARIASRKIWEALTTQQDNRR